jgi:predicted PurR-regulated permease PerM
MTLSSSAEAQARGIARWRSLRARLQTVTPQALARGGIALGVIALSAWLAVASWPALAPFLVGAVIAYAVLPVANRLDRFMPRVLAAVLAELIAVAILVGVAIVVVPPLLNGLVRVALALPTADQVQASLAELQTQLGQLPEPVRGIVLAVTTDVVANLQATLNGMVDGAGTFVTQQILGILSTVTFVLGLLVIPAWILTIVADERSIKRRGASLLAPAIRADVAALFRIVDRAMGTFLRVRVLLAIMTAVLVWLGLELLQRLGIGTYPYAVTAGVLLGALQLIPELGFYLGFLLLPLVLVSGGPVPALGGAAAYVVAVKGASALVETRVSRGVLDVHAGLMIPAIVVFSQFGLAWALVAAPIVAIIRDVVRYAAGRLGDPPAPANVLPGERRRAARVVAAAVVAPSVYRDRRSARNAPGAPSPAPRSAAVTAGPAPAVATPAAARPAAATTSVAAATPVPAFASVAPRPSAAAVIERSTRP